jgi:hypothetical protein
MIRKEMGKKSTNALLRVIWIRRDTVESYLRRDYFFCPRVIIERSDIDLGRAKLRPEHAFYLCKADRQTPIVHFIHGHSALEMIKALPQLPCHLRLHVHLLRTWNLSPALRLPCRSSVVRLIRCYLR